MSRSYTFLIGSPKPSGSTSESLADHLMGRLESEGERVSKVSVRKALASEEAMNDLLDRVQSSDVIVLCFPLYYYTLPAICLEAMTLIRRRYSEKAPTQGLLAIVNQGFPEESHAEQALESCRSFCDHVSIGYIGGLVMPAGGVVNGEPLMKVRGRVRSQIKGLNMAAMDLVNGDPIGSTAAKAMARPPMSPWLYRIIANRNWKRMARKNGTMKQLKDRPYA